MHKTTLDAYWYKFRRASQAGRITTGSPCVQFNPADHTYTINGRRLRSATELVGMLKPEFDKDEAALSGFRVGAKPGWAKRKVEEWDAVRDVACAKGKAVHAEAEKVVTAPGATSGVLTGLPGWVQRHSDMLFCEVAEWVIGDAELGVAGTPDAVCYSRVTGLRHIFDWKTNRRFRVSSRWKLKEPFSDLDDCELNCYSLQTSIYRLLVSRATKWKTGDSWVVHVGPDGTVTPHKALDLRKRLLEWVKGLPPVDENL